MSRKTPRSGDVQELQGLLVWARQNGIVLSSVSIGMVTVEVASMAVAQSKGRRESKPSNLYSEIGGALIEKIAASAPELVAGEDYQPAVTHD